MALGSIYSYVGKNSSVTASPDGTVSFSIKTGPISNDVSVSQTSDGLEITSGSASASYGSETYGKVKVSGGTTTTTAPDGTVTTTGNGITIGYSNKAGGLGVGINIKSGPMVPHPTDPHAAPIPSATITPEMSIGGIKIKGDSVNISPDDIFDPEAGGPWGGGLLGNAYNKLRHRDRDIDAAVDGNLTAATNFRQPVDPLTFDLDGDGIETVGINTAAPILFDHNGDGVKTATGWVAPDDGFLVLDRNNNGTIDSGRELFGDSTSLAAGGNAVDGFAALVQEDTNLDGKVNAADARFADLRIWRDLNQDGVSQAGELSTLAALGIASINVTKTQNSTLLGNGNVIADLGTYTKTDGSIGTLGDTAQLGDVNLASNSFISQFTDSVPITAQAAALPDMQGSGQVRDLREAASLSASLVTALSSYAAGATRDAQITQLDSLLKAWSDTSTMATTATGAYAGHALTVNFAGITSGSAAYQAWLDKLTVLERFNGRTFQTVPTGTAPVTLNISSGQMNLLNQSYAALENSVYGALVLQTRFKPLIESIGLVLTADGIELDFSAVQQTLQTRIDTSAADGLKDLIDFNRFSGLSGAGWDGWTMLGNAMSNAPGTVVDAVLDEMKLRVSANFNGTAGDDFAFATNGNDYLSGNAGADTLFGQDGTDTLNGGAGA
ncbi:MAG: hypothetical protein IV098_10935, partial [Thiobacillus sp.]|nr:hypothetical protein [Thiobacillus sp.]